MAALTIVSGQQSPEIPNRSSAKRELIQQPMPNRAHSEAVTRLIRRIPDCQDDGTPIQTYAHLCVKLAKERYVLTDVAIYAGNPPKEAFPSTPPNIAAEVISRGDRFSEVLTKLAEYRAWGVPHIWLIDPQTRQLFEFGAEGLRTVPQLSVPEFHLTLTPTQILPQH